MSIAKINGFDMSDCKGYAFNGIDTIILYTNERDKQELESKGNVCNFMGTGLLQAYLDAGAYRNIILFKDGSSKTIVPVDCDRVTFDCGKMEYRLSSVSDIVNGYGIEFHWENGNLVVERKKAEQLNRKTEFVAYFNNTPEICRSRQRAVELLRRKLVVSLIAKGIPLDEIKKTAETLINNLYANGEYQFEFPMFDNRSIKEVYKVVPMFAE